MNICEYLNISGTKPTATRLQGIYRKTKKPPAWRVILNRKHAVKFVYENSKNQSNFRGTFVKWVKSCFAGLSFGGFDFI